MDLTNFRQESAQSLKTGAVNLNETNSGIQSQIGLIDNMNRTKKLNLKEDRENINGIRGRKAIDNNSGNMEIGGTKMKKNVFSEISNNLTCRN